MLLVYILIFSALGSVGALTGAGVLLVFPNLHGRVKTLLLGYAVGTLLGAAFIALIPEALERHPDEQPIMLTLLAGLLGFFVLEKVLRLPHLHAHETEGGKHGSSHRPIPAGELVLIGDAFHNFVDGVVIAAAFSASIPLGVVTSLAILAHEVPQELSDFVILLESGWGRWKAYRWNFVSALATIPGALTGFLALQVIEPGVPFILAIAASSFLYIATVDIAPILQHESGLKKTVSQLAGLFLGAATIFGLQKLLG